MSKNLESKGECGDSELCQFTRTSIWNLFYYMYTDM